MVGWVREIECEANGKQIFHEKVFSVPQNKIKFCITLSFINFLGTIFCSNAEIEFI